MKLKKERERLRENGEEQRKGRREEGRKGTEGRKGRKSAGEQIINNEMTHKKRMGVKVECGRNVEKRQN